MAGARKKPLERRKIQLVLNVKASKLMHLVTNKRLSEEAKEKQIKEIAQKQYEQLINGEGDE